MMGKILRRHRIKDVAESERECVKNEPNESLPLPFPKRLQGSRDDIWDK